MRRITPTVSFTGLKVFYGGQSPAAQKCKKVSYDDDDYYVDGNNVAKKKMLSVKYLNLSML